MIFVSNSKSLCHDMRAGWWPKRKLTTIMNKRNAGVITIPDHKLYYRAIIIKTQWYWHKKRNFDKHNWIQDPNTNITPMNA